MDSTVINAECVIITAVGVALWLYVLLKILGRNRPGFSIGKPLAVGYGLRLLAMAAVSTTGIGSTLRGGDEIGFLSQAQGIAALPWTNGQWLPTAHQSFLHVLVFASQIKLLGNSQTALRIAQIGIALTGVVLIVAAVYDLAGPRAAKLTAWILSLEVASLFFNSLLHKEPLMELSSGMVVLGGAKVWKRLELRGVLLLGAGGLIALGTRQYVGWFLFSCGVLIIFHASLRKMGTHLRTLPLIYGVVVVIVVATPAILAASSHQSLQALQNSQNANTTPNQSGGANSNNLALEKVDFSSRGAIISNLPKRIRDVLLRPYPWQVGNTNQILGVAGSLIAIAVFVLTIRYAILSREHVLGRAGPILYTFFFLLIAYALAVGNAGTGYRYRTHLVTLAVAVMVVLREGVLQTQAAKVDEARSTSDQVVATGRGQEAPAF